MKKLILIFSLIFTLTSCKEVYRYINYTFYSMSTVVDVIRNEDIEEDYTKKIVTDIENKMSRTLSDSEISKLNRGEDVSLSHETIKLLKKSLEIAQATDYAFNPCMGTLTDLWDITSGKNNVPTDEEIKQMLLYCNAWDVKIEGDRVIIPDGMKIDVGGIAKGYALNKSTAELIESATKSGASQDFCISLGGNVSVLGSSPSMKRLKKKGWKVGITNPFDKTEIMGSVTLSHGFVSVSGGYERYFKKNGNIYHHIFDINTGYPAQTDLASAVVISDDGLLSDALSTALFVMGTEKSVDFYNKHLYNFKMILITNNHEVILAGIEPDCFTPNESDSSFIFYGIHEWNK